MRRWRGGRRRAGRILVALLAIGLLGGCQAAPGSEPASPTVEPPAQPTSAPPPSGPGVVTPGDGDCPPGYPIKGRGGAQGERWYYLVDSADYATIAAEVCFATIDEAHEAGYGPPP